jgi:hypothetical protein
MTPVLPVSERKLRHVAVSWAAPGQATACQYLLSVVPAAQHKGTWRLNSNVRFSNRQVRVKRFQTIHCRGVDVARGLCVARRNCSMVSAGRRESSIAKFMAAAMRSPMPATMTRALQALARAQEYSAYGALHRNGAGSLQGFLAHLIRALR